MIGHRPRKSEQRPARSRASLPQSLFGFQSRAVRRRHKESDRYPAPPSFQLERYRAMDEKLLLATEFCAEAIATRESTAAPDTRRASSPFPSPISKPRKSAARRSLPSRNVPLEPTPRRACPACHADWSRRSLARRWKSGRRRERKSCPERSRMGRMGASLPAPADDVMRRSRLSKRRRDL